MTVVQYKPSDEQPYKSVSLNEGETVLDALLRSGFDVPFGCKAGVCQSCLVKVTEGDLPTGSQVGLRDSQIDQGLVLACSCKPADSIKVASADLAEQLVPTKVIEIFPLNPHVYCLRVEKTIDYRPGQFVTLWNDSNIARSYSIASHPEQDDFIEFHIKRIPDGEFSDWAYQNLGAGDTLRIQGPMGECYYGETQNDQSLLLSCIGTGLAPLVGVLNDALERNHSGIIDLVIGARDPSSFYFLDKLNALSKQYANLTVHCVFQSDGDPHEDNLTKSFQGDVYQYCQDNFSDLKERKIFLCGAESFVRKMKRQSFLNGAAMKNILSDPFVAFHKSSP